MLTVLLNLLSYIVHSLHRVNIGLLYDDLKVLRHIPLLLRLSVNDIELSTLVGTETVLKENSDSSRFALHEGVSLE